MGAGVSAGMDMILYFIACVLGDATAQQAAKFAEYNGQWRNSKDDVWGEAVFPTPLAAVLGSRHPPTAVPEVQAAKTASHHSKLDPPI